MPFCDCGGDAFESEIQIFLGEESVRNKGFLLIIWLAPANGSKIIEICQ